MKFALDFPAPRTLAIIGSEERFAPHRVFCVGRNYAAHAREMGGDERDPPFFFMKPASAIVDASRPIDLPYPPKTNDFHHEVELVVAIGRSGSNIPASTALEHVYAYGVGLDMTRRDLQSVAKKKGRPWEFAKAFANSAPISALRRSQEIGHPQDSVIELRVNSQIRQSSRLSMQIWSVAECISVLSQFDPLQVGDLIMTGTPEGVGPVVIGDALEGRIAGVSDIDVRIVDGKSASG